MATNINTGTPLRLNSGGTISIWNTGASTEYAPLHVVAGSVKAVIKPRERIPISSFGAFTGDVVEGDQQMNEFELSVLLTKLGQTGSPDLHSLINPAASGGKVPTFKIEIKNPDGNGASTGTKISFLKCFLSDDGENFDYVEGKAVDKLTMKFMDVGGPPTIATY